MLSPQTGHTLFLDNACCFPGLIIYTDISQHKVWKWMFSFYCIPKPLGMAKLHQAWVFNSTKDCISFKYIWHCTTDPEGIFGVLVPSHGVRSELIWALSKYICGMAAYWRVYSLLITGGLDRVQLTLVTFASLIYDRQFWNFDTKLPSSFGSNQKAKKSYSVITIIRAVAFLNCFNEAWQKRPILCWKTHGQIPTPLKTSLFLILIYFRW